MRLHVQLFARARELAATATVVIDLPDAACVSDLRHALSTQHPQLAPLLQRSALAVNGEFADDTDSLPANAEIALLPPVSGGGE